MLCTNRPEGFGPSSKLSSPLPTSCFVDVILIPLPIWIALFLLPIFFAISIRYRKQHYNPSTAHLRVKSRRGWGFIATSGIYYILIICNILMQTLEIVRLALLKYGIGLQPFVYVGLLLGALLHWSEGLGGRVRGWQMINAVLWIGGIVMTVIQVVGLSKEGINGRAGSKYPISDQVTDVAVMAGVYAVIAILELILDLWRASKKAGSKESVESGSPVPMSGDLK